MAAVSAAATPSATLVRQPPNVVFFLVDDLGWTDLGCYGSDFYRTPNIDRLAATGMKFTQNYSACNACSPTRAALMTGMYPAPHAPDRLDSRVGQTVRQFSTAAAAVDTAP